MNEREHHHGHRGPGGRGERVKVRRPDFRDEPGYEDDVAYARVRGYGPPFPGFFGPGMHGGPPEFGGWPRGRGRRGGRARRGDVRAAALALLAEGPMNGYQIIQQINERSGGLWRASPGSVYPALAQLEDENLIEQQGGERGRRAYQLTEQGQEYVTEHRDELNEPWAAMTGSAASAAIDMRTVVHQVHLAAVQVVSAGTDSQVARARTVLTEARKALYRILAEDDEAQDGEGG
jgi:DNA-binding PadR family transcriptional regulator